MPVELHHRIVGPVGAPVVLLAGSLGTNLAMWGPQVAALGGRFRAVAFDHRGHGDSPVPDGPYTIEDLGGDVLALLDRLSIDRAAFVGISIGGMVGQWLAIHAPERIERLVVVCSSAHPDPGPFRERAEKVRAAGSTEPLADAVVARWFTRGWAAAHPDQLAFMRQMIVATPAEGYAGCCEALAELDLRDGLARVVASTLVVAGAQDEALPPEHSRLIADTIPGARYEELDPAAHIASVERAEDANALILQHLDGAFAAR